MIAPACYIPNRGIDGPIASYLGWSAKGDIAKVASLRNLYDYQAALNKTEPLLPMDNPTNDDLRNAAQKLINFRKAIREAHRAKMQTGKKHIDRAYDVLRHAYTLGQRKDRISLLSNLFSSEVDRLMAGGKVDRQSIVQGFLDDNGNLIGGEFSILESVYNYILKCRAAAHNVYYNPKVCFDIMKERTKEAHREGKRGPLDYVGAPTTAEEYKVVSEKRYEEYTKILECWNELVPFVLKDLVAKEGVKLGIKKNYAASADSDSYSEDDIAAKWSLEESTRDGFQKIRERESAFGSVGQQVRRMLATVPLIEQVPVSEPYQALDGTIHSRTTVKSLPVVDDLGNPKFMDPIRTHQELQEFLKGVGSSKEMLSRMCKDGKPGTAKIAWMQPIVDLLISNPKARTAFFCDFKRNFQPYSVMYEDKAEGDLFHRIIKTRVLNKSKNYLKGRYEIAILPNGKLPANVRLWGYKTVFDAETKEVDWERLAELREKVLSWTSEIRRNAEENQSKNVLNNLTRYNANKAEDIIVAPLISNAEDNSIIINGKPVEVTYEMKREFLMEVFTSLGYDVTVDTVDSILHSSDIYTVNDQLNQLFNPDGQFTGFLYAAGVASLDSKNITKLSKEHRSFKGLYNTSKTNKETKKKSYPVKEHSEKLLDTISKHQEGYRVESRVRYRGNTLYSFVSPSYLGDRLETIRSYVEADNKKGLLEFLKNEYLCSPYFVDDEYLATNGDSGKILNMWLSELVDACKKKKVPLMDSVAAIFGYERDLGSEEKEFEDFSIKDHAFDMFIHFFADEQLKKGYGGKGTNNLQKKLSALFPVFVLGDAGVSKYIRAPRICSVVPFDKEGNRLSNADAAKRTSVKYLFDEDAQKKVLDAFYNIYLQERRRMALEKAFPYDLYANGKKVKHTEGEFSFLTFLNPLSQEYREEYAIPTKVNPITGETELDDTRENVQKIIQQYLQDATEVFKQRLEGLGVLETDEEGKTFKNISTIATPDNIEAKIKECFWNTKLATTQQLQLMTIDPAFYHGTKDLQKRYKEIHAPGTLLDVAALYYNGSELVPYSSDGIERVVYFEDINIDADETNPEFMEVMRKIFKDNPEVVEKYKENTLTDGQGYRTLSSYRKVMGMSGKWTEEMENAYKTIMQIRSRHIADDSDTTPEELEQIAKFAVVFQPIKPYMFTHEKYAVKINKKDAQGKDVIGADGKPVKVDTTMLIPVQHKYAEALIIPELLPKGNKLRDLANWMEANNVDMVGSTKIGKVGVFGQADIQKVTNKEELNAAMSSAYIHELPYSDYRIQTNVPEHINSSQLFGTQVRKLIMAGLLMEKGFYDQYFEGMGNFDGTVNLSTDDKHNKECRLDGKNLLALYNSLICANVMDSYDIFSQNAGDIKALSDLLQQSTIGSMREAMDNIFSYVVTGSEKDLQKFLIPLFEGGLEHDAAALILSTFKKIVNKQQISGGSAVQVSAFGIEGYEADGGLRAVTDPDNDENILYAEIEIPFDRSFTMDVKAADGTVTKSTVSLPYERYCFSEGRYDGYLIPTGKALEKGTKEWKKYQSYTYKKVDGKLVPCKYSDPDAEVYKPLIEKEYPGILSILAYRIPTERDYSMINCQVKKFTRKTAGGTLKVPPQWTTIAGFDFDIDKLYFMQREYHRKYNEVYSDSAYDIWTEFYNNNPLIANALTVARNQWADAHPDKVKWLPVMKDGVDTGRKIKDVKSLPYLHEFWKEAKITEKYGKSKQVAFAETAQKMGLNPEQDVENTEEYDFSKSPEENTRAARNNLLITLIQARLMDPHTAKQRYTPGGFSNASNAALRMRVLQFADIDAITTNGVVDDVKVDAVMAKIKDKEDPMQDPEPNYDPTDPYTILIYNQQNQLAAKLIGIFANQNTNHAFASSMDVFELVEPIEFCGHSFKDFLHRDPDDAARIDLNMAEFLAASVDAVKDPVLNFLNLNTITADAGAMLARLGYSTKEIGMLLCQPIIRKVCEDALDKGYSNAQHAIDDAAKFLESYLTGIKVNGKTAPLTEKDLATGIIGERKTIEGGGTRKDYLVKNAEMQMKVLQLFSKIYKASQDVSQFVLNTKFTASNAVSSTLGGMYAQQQKVDTYVDKFPKNAEDKGGLSYKMVVSIENSGSGLMDKPIDNNEALTIQPGEKPSAYKKRYLHYVRFNPFAYEQAMYDANRNAIKLLSRYFPYERPLYKSIRDKLQSLARYGSLSEEDINAIHSNIPVALLAKQENSLFNGEALHPGTNITNREYYREKFAEVVKNMIAEDPDGFGSLAIFKFIYPIYDEVADGKDADGADKFKDVWSMEMQDIGGMDADTKEEIRESWASLMEVQDSGHFDSVDYAEIGRDLFMYCFYQLGFEFSPISFMHLAPTAVKDCLIVDRSSSIGPKHWSGEIKANSDDVYVWNSSMIGAFDRATIEFGADSSRMNVLSGNSFQLEDMSPNGLRAFLEEAYSHPELKFKLAMDLTQEEFDELAKAGDIPSNVYFSPATHTERSDGRAISYGKRRTYREFLNGILDGTEQGLDEDEFAQMWILNHLDNSRFVLDTYKSGDRLREIIKKQISAEGNTQIVNGIYRDYITIDVSTYDSKHDKDALKSLVSIKTDDKGRIIESKWCPCIIINGVYYMAESGTAEGFNINADMKIRYRKVVPWGCSKTIEYDNGKKLTPQMRYQTSMIAEPERPDVQPSASSTSIENNSQGTQPEGNNQPITSSSTPSVPSTDPINGSGADISKTRDEMWVYAYNQFYLGLQERFKDSPKELSEHLTELTNQLNSATDEQLDVIINNLKVACRKNGVLMLDKDGNPMMGC